MPIKCSRTVAALSDADFTEIDYNVMACAYASQNSLGRLCDEHVYENDLAARLKEHGFEEVHTQVPITVSLGQFSKTYWLDLVVDGLVYELKTVEAWALEHDSQAIHYAALLGIDRVKLLNFRSRAVSGKLVRCPLGKVNRSQLQLIEERWQPFSKFCETLKRQVRTLLTDWGAFLQVQLYEEALVHFFGGPSVATHRVRVARDGLELGTQRMHLHADLIAFHVTAYTHDCQEYEQHLLRPLRSTSLRAIQWINLNHATIEFITLHHNPGNQT